MIKVSVLYPYTEGASFDMDYYFNSHIPMVREKLGTACTGISVDQGLGGTVPGTPPAFVVMAHLSFDTVGEFQAAFAPHAKEIEGDIANYTSIPPTVQISDVKV
ncbi:MAG TPA: EthD family reductase [Blastocatellia bacterium]|nr:EthD family reductase [Blastocatellia bacterium]